ncbi:helix-turn-helix transcriptional regulator [Streptomyces sp. NPDC051940]|uniref:helix-turn-helix transcriptional regulator n=1 Tax=Streptomyces sp. NPDC051940 TaxID=3155675 RepID=UPI0034160397
MTTSADARRELAAFLRSRRERISPEQVGMPAGRRRRTPGLRREEVATLAAVGVTWYTWLEQARDIQISAQVADAIARALMMDRDERAHLFHLAGVPDPTPQDNCLGVSPQIQSMLRQLEPFPACVTNGRYDIVSYNRTYGRLVGDLDALPPQDRNILWLAFTHPAWQEGLADRDEMVRLMAAKFRASMAEHLTEPPWKTLLKRLQDASAEFREIWDRHEVLQPDNRSKCFLNPDVGRLTFDFRHLFLQPGTGPRLTTYIPADAETGVRLERLYDIVRAPALAAV